MGRCLRPFLALLPAFPPPLAQAQLCARRRRPPCGGWRIGRGEAAVKGLPLTVATGATIQALFDASCAPMSSVLGWAPGAHNAVAKFWRLGIAD